MVRSPTVTSYQQVPLRDGEIRSFRLGQVSIVLNVILSVYFHLERTR
jgi:hypothetical protein